MIATVFQFLLEALEGTHRNVAPTSAFGDPKHVVLGATDKERARPSLKKLDRGGEIVVNHEAAAASNPDSAVNHSVKSPTG